MFWFQLVVVLLLLAAVGWLAVGGGGHMSEPVPDRADLALPDDRQVVARDLDQVRFSVGLRGYRMEEVDDVLDRLAREVEARDRRIAELEGRPYVSPYAANGTAAGSRGDAEGGEGATGDGGDGGEAQSLGAASDVSSEASAQAPSAQSPAASAASPESADGEPGSGYDLPPLP